MPSLFADVRYLSDWRAPTQPLAMDALSSSLGTKFFTPLHGTPYKTWSIVNYVDLNSGPGSADFKGR